MGGGGDPVDQLGWAGAGKTCIGEASRTAAAGGDRREAGWSRAESASVARKEDEDDASVGEDEEERVVRTEDDATKR